RRQRTSVAAHRSPHILEDQGLAHAAILRHTPGPVKPRNERSFRRASGLRAAVASVVSPRRAEFCTQGCRIADKHWSSYAVLDHLPGRVAPCCHSKFRAGARIIMILT